MSNIIKKLHQDQKGQTFIELALVIIFVALTSAVYFTPLGEAIGAKVGEITEKVASIGTS